MYSHVFVSIWYHLHVYMYMYVFCICMYKCIHAYVCLYLYVSVYPYIYVYSYMLVAQVCSTETSCFDLAILLFTQSRAQGSVDKILAR